MNEGPAHFGVLGGAGRAESCLRRDAHAELLAAVHELLLVEAAVSTLIDLLELEPDLAEV